MTPSERQSERVSERFYSHPLALGAQGFCVTQFRPYPATEAGELPKENSNHSGFLAPLLPQAPLGVAYVNSERQGTRVGDAGGRRG